MDRMYVWAWVIGLSSLGGCDPEDTSVADGGDAAEDAQPDGQPDGMTDATTDGGSALQWFATCGDPVCMSDGHRDSGLPECETGQEVGLSCESDGATCDPLNDCNSHLVCSNEDPTLGPVGCPISRRRFKEDIEYLSKADRERLHEELMAVDLATYRYKRQADARRHLGFIMDEVEPSLAVDSAHNVVDLYAYASMAVAALQTQNERIAALERELERLRSGSVRGETRRALPHR